MQHPGHVGIGPVRRPTGYLVAREPSPATEFARVWSDLVVGVEVEEEPERAIEVAVRADGGRDGEKQRALILVERVRPGQDAEFLVRLSHDGFPRWLARLDMTAGSLGSRMLSYPIFLGSTLWMVRCGGRLSSTSSSVRARGRRGNKLRSLRRSIAELGPTVRGTVLRSS